MIAVMLSIFFFVDVDSSEKLGKEGFDIY